MRSGRVLFCIFLIAVSGYAIHSAAGWSFKTGFFPLAVSIPLILLASVQLWQEIFGKAENFPETSVDLDFSSDLPAEVVRRRALVTFAWIAAFILGVYLIGFPLTVPLFIFTYLKYQSEVGWRRSLVLTAISWGFFHALFERLVHLQFEAGALQTWLGL